MSTTVKIEIPTELLPRLHDCLSREHTKATLQAMNAHHTLASDWWQTRHDVGRLLECIGFARHGFTRQPEPQQRRASR